MREVKHELQWVLGRELESDWRIAITEQEDSAGRGHMYCLKCRSLGGDEVQCHFMAGLNQVELNP
jgi:hypothetical protein